MGYFNTDTDPDPSDIFVTNGYPEYTFVQRDKSKLKENLEDYMYDRGQVLSIYGPSKAGKTVLVQNSVKEDDGRQMARIAASQIDDPADLWDKAINNMGASTTVERTSGKKGGIVLKVINMSGKKEKTVTIEKTGYPKLIEYRDKMNLDDIVVMIDDFHELDPQIYSELGGLLKRASESEIRLCVAQIESRKYDLSEKRDDLRITPLKVSNWTKEELAKIAKKGFEKHLNVKISDTRVEQLATESGGSPFIMQTLCLDICRIKGIDEKMESDTKILLTDSDMRQVFSKTLNSFPKNIERNFKLLKSGGSGGGRKQRQFADGTTGDIYEAIMRALAEDPPQRKYDEYDLEKRLISVLKDENELNNMGNIKQRCDTLQGIVSDEYFHFDNDLYELTIEDPGLLFYIRHTDRI